MKVKERSQKKRAVQIKRMQREKRRRISVIFQIPIKRMKLMESMLRSWLKARLKHVPCVDEENFLPTGYSDAGKPTVTECECTRGEPA